MEEEKDTCNPMYKTCPYIHQPSYAVQDVFQQQMQQSADYSDERVKEYIPVISYGHGSVASDFWYGDGPYYPNYYYGEYPYPYANYPYYPLHPPYPKLYKK